MTNSLCVWPVLLYGLGASARHTLEQRTWVEGVRHTHTALVVLAVGGRIAWGVEWGLAGPEDRGADTGRHFGRQGQFGGHRVLELLQQGGTLLGVGTRTLELEGVGSRRGKALVVVEEGVHNLVEVGVRRWVGVGVRRLVEEGLAVVEWVEG